jgi:hypothetical protein
MSESPFLHDLSVTNEEFGAAATPMTIRRFEL